MKEQISPNWHWLHIAQDILPLLRARAVT